MQQFFLSRITFAFLSEEQTAAESMKNSIAICFLRSELLSSGYHDHVKTRWIQTIFSAPKIRWENFQRGVVSKVISPNFLYHIALIHSWSNGCNFQSRRKHIQYLLFFLLYLHKICTRLLSQWFSELKFESNNCQARNWKLSKIKCNKFFFVMYNFCIFVKRADGSGIH